MVLRRVAVGIVVLGAAGLVLHLYPQGQTPPQIQSPRARSFLVLFGIGDRTGAVWDGSVTATGAEILSVQGWRFADRDAVNGTSWRLSTRLSPAGVAPAGMFLEENGVVVTVADNGSPVRFSVKTTQGDAGSISFSSQDVPFGTMMRSANGRILVTEVPAPLQLTNSNEEEDYPSMAQSGDDVYLAYTRFVHGDRSQAQFLSTKTAITNFDFLARPTGGEQVFLLHYSKSQRIWNGPFPITSNQEDVMRTAVAVDGQGRAWVFYSTQRSGNFDLFAERVAADGSTSSEVRITSDPGPDLFPVAATDLSGRVWVAWQGFRNNNLEILAAVQQGDTFSAEAIVSTSPASDWDPAIATAGNGEVAISWDTYDKGDYDVYVRRVHFSDQIGMDDPIPVAVSANLEARSSIAYDSQNKLWIAYEVSGPKWGKDFGAYDTTGIGLYQYHSIQVRCLIGTDLYATLDDVARVLPGAPAVQMLPPPASTAPPVQPDPTIAQKRQPNGGVGGAASAKNSFPRLATDSDGTVYLAYRVPNGDGISTSSATGQSVGSIWSEELVYFDGAQWSKPGVFADSDGLLDNRPVLMALAPGRLLIAQAMDHRLSPLPNGTPQVDGTNSDIYALELPVTRNQQSPQLQRLPPVAPSTPDPGVTAEAASAALLRNYRPTINGQPLQLVRGDFHRHTEISFDGRNDGPLVDAYRYAIDAASLNWFTCCDHDNGGAREYTWSLSQKYTDAYLLGTAFVPMFYYERSIAYPEGHRNVLFAQRGVRPLPRLPLSPVNSTAPAPDTLMLYQYLRRFNGMTAAHTIATDQGTDWRNNDPLVEPMLEIYQGDRQSYEMPGSPRSNSPNDSISGYEALGYVPSAFSKGYQLGFEASSDHVSTHISFTNLWVTAPTRAAILDAVSKRRVYGSTDYILADFRSGPHFMGEAFTTSSPPTFSVKLWGTNDFQNISIIKDNTVVYSNPGDRVTSFTWQDTAAQKGKTSYYYVRGLQTDGQVVWVSPMWVTLQ